jgi:serine/threonine protein kinase
MLKTGDCVGDQKWQHQYTVENFIGKGTFGFVYSVTNDSGKKYALKLSLNKEEQKQKQKQDDSVLSSLHRIEERHHPTRIDIEYFILHKYSLFCQPIHIGNITASLPFVTLKGTSVIHNKSCSVLVEQLLRCNFQSLKTQPKSVFVHNLSYMKNISIALILLLEQIHKLGFVHADLKPENIMLDFERGNNNLYLIDFGLAYSILPSNKDDVLYWKNVVYEKNFRGNFKFASLRSMCRYLHQIKDSPPTDVRDDIESCLYVLIYLYSDEKFPWTSNTSQSFSFSHIYQKKRDESLTFAQTHAPFLYQPLKYVQEHEELDRSGSTKEGNLDYGKIVSWIRDFGN